MGELLLVFSVCLLVIAGAAIVYWVDDDYGTH